VTNYLCLAFIVLILVVMYLTPPIRISVMLIPAWILVLWVAFKLKKRRWVRFDRGQARSHDLNRFVGAGLPAMLSAALVAVDHFLRRAERIDRRRHAGIHGAMQQRFANLSTVQPLFNAPRTCP
jgi:uncharacterized membrane protein